MPKLLTTPFATSGSKNDVPTTTGSSANSATYDKGFPDITMTSFAYGGLPPSGKDFNGIFYDITDNIVYQTQGGRYKFDSAYATSIGGYPLGAILLLNDGVTDVVSTVANNVNNPNTSMTGWVYKSQTLVTNDYTTLAALSAKDGVIAFVKKDGISGEFVYNSASTATENGGTIIASANGGNWLRVFNGAVNIKWFGAKGDGVTDDAPIFQKINDLGLGVSEVVLPHGCYFLNSAVNLNNQAIHWRGEGFAVAPNISTGTWFKITDTSFTPFTITLGTQETRGTKFSNIAIWQSQPDTSLETWSPNSYPPVFNVVDLLGEFTLENIYGCDISRLVKSVGAGRMHFNNIFGQFFNNCIDIDNCLDAPHIVGLHAWTYWTSSDSVLAYQQNNLNVIELGRCDSPFIDRIFCFAANSLVYTKQTTYGYSTKVMGGSWTADFTRYGLYVGSPEFTAQIVSLNTEGELWHNGGGDGTPLTDAYSFKVVGNNARFSIGSMLATRLKQEAVHIDSTGCQIHIGHSQVRYINTDGGSGVVNAAAGNSVTVDHSIITDSNNALLTSPYSSIFTSKSTKAYQIQNEVNRIITIGSATGNEVNVATEGNDTNISMVIAGKGNGHVRITNPMFGSYITGASAATGYITVLDINGVPRKLLCY